MRAQAVCVQRLWADVATGRSGRRAQIVPVSAWMAVPARCRDLSNARVLHCPSSGTAQGARQAGPQPGATFELTAHRPAAVPMHIKVICELHPDSCLRDTTEPRKDCVRVLCRRHESWGDTSRPSTEPGRHERVRRRVDRRGPGCARSGPVTLRFSGIALAYCLDRSGDELLQHSDVNVAQAPNRQARLSHLVFAEASQ